MTQTQAVQDKLFIGVYPCGLVYADRSREEGGDYARLAFLDYATLALDIKDNCPADLRKEVTEHAAGMQGRQGEPYQISSAGQTVTLGSRLPNAMGHNHSQSQD